MERKRTAYIDVMRGITMMLVVYQHIRSYSIGLDVTHSDFATLFILFRMPMFFFISGYVAYKSIENWDVVFYKNRLLKKAQVQLLPTIVFFIILSLYQQSNINPYGFPGGYWFTIVLFEMFVIYFTFSVIGKYTDSKVTYILLILTALLLLFVDAPESRNLRFLCISQLRGYFRFFVIGIFCKKFIAQFHGFITNKYGGLIIVSTSIALLLFYHLNLLYIFSPIGLILELILRTSLVFTIYLFFYNSRNFWDSNNFLSTTFQFIGRRTLDLYLLHYFFLPNIPQTFDFFAASGNEIIEFFCLSILTIIITGVSLLASKFIRLSKILAHWLFGANNSQFTLSSNK